MNWPSPHFVFLCAPCDEMTATHFFCRITSGYWEFRIQAKIKVPQSMRSRALKKSKIFLSI